MSARILLTTEIARADAHDTATRRMRREGRSRWNAADHRAACERLAALMRHIDPEVARAYARDLGMETA
jgi:hypothetical protein